MFDTLKITTCFNDLVGWRDSALSPGCIDDLSAALTTSTSNLFFEDIPGISLELVTEMLSRDKDGIETYLTEVGNSEAINLINDFIQRQKALTHNKSILNNFGIGTRIGNIRELETKRSRFVGFKIIPRNANGVQVDITQIGVQFDTLQAPLKIFFYASDNFSPVKEFNITTTKKFSVEWFELADFIAKYISQNDGESTDTEYYIGYYEDDLVGQAVFTQTSCIGCNNHPSQKYGKYVHIHPIEVQAGATFLSRELFDVDQVGETDATHGLHLRINVTCDVSDVICDNALRFANAYQKKVAIRILWDTFNSKRLNRITVMSKDEARMMAEKYELDLFGEGSGGEIDRIVIDFSSIDQVCFPCKKRALGAMQLT